LSAWIPQVVNQPPTDKLNDSVGRQQFMAHPVDGAVMGVAPGFDRVNRVLVTVAVTMSFGDLQNYSKVVQDFVGLV
jgi:hypothetical protein